MSIDEPGNVETPNTVPTPAEHSAPSPQPFSESEAKDFLAKKLSEDDDVGDYIKERNLQDREAGRGEVDETDMRGRSERVTKVLEKERLLEEQKQLKEGHAPGPSPEELEHEREVERRRWRNEGAFESRLRARAAELPDFSESMVTFKYHPLREDIAEIVHESEMGPDLAYQLAQSPHAIAALNDLPPEKAAHFLGRLEEKLISDQREAKRAGQPAPRRLQTKAAPPIRAPTGGASPTRDIHELAKSDDLSAYVAMRNQEDARR